MDLRPIFALFVRAVRVESRQVSTYVWRACMLIVLGFVLWTVMDYSRYSDGVVGLTLFEMTTDWNLSFVILGGLVFFSTSITEEKEEGTLALLRMTKLQALSILLGKSASRLFSMVMLMCAQVPLMILSVTLGGVSLELIGRVMLSVLACMVLLNGVGTFSSTVSRNSASAMLLTLVILSVIIGLPKLAREMGYGGLAFLEYLNPVLYIVRHFNIFTGPSVPIQEYLVWPLVAALIFYALAWVCFDPCNGPEDTREKRGLRRRKVRKSALRVESPRGRVWTGKALRWKEYQFHQRGWLGWSVKLVLLLCLTGGIMAYQKLVPVFRGLASMEESWYWDIQDFDDLRVTLIIVSAGCGFLLLVWMTSTRLRAEISHNTLSDLYLATSSGWSIYWAKIRGMLVALSPFVLGILSGFLMRFYLNLEDEGFSVIRFPEVFAMIFALGSFLIMAAALNVYYSLALKWVAVLATMITVSLLLYFFIQLVMPFRDDELGAVVMGLLFIGVSVVTARLTVKALDRYAARA